MMMSKFSLVAAAAALAISSQAYAFGPTVVPDIIINIGGSSGQAEAFLHFATWLMQPGFDIYTDSACGTQGANYRAVFGVITTTLPNGARMPANLVGMKTYITYASNGGTFKNGIDGLVRSHAIEVQQFLNNSTACPVVIPSPEYATNYTVTDRRLIVSNIPLIGLSDEEVSLFTGVNVPAGLSAIQDSEILPTKVTLAYLYANVFGIAINSLLAAQKTNFTKAEITAIYTGAYTDWSQLGLPAGPITFIDLSAGSGSKAAFNQYFLNNPGANASGGALLPNVIATSKGNCGAPATHGSGSYDNTTGGDCAQSSDGNVKAALNNANTAGVRAIGILGLEFEPGSTDHYTFASLNGVAVRGTLAKTCGNAVAHTFDPHNVVSGAYDLFFTGSLQFRTPDHTANSTNRTFIDAFLAVASDPATEVGVPGVMLDTQVIGGPAGDAYDDCILKGTYFLNSTQPLQLLF